jgi:hypothetical protein
MDIEYVLNIATVASLLLGGLIFLYQGADYIRMKKNDRKIPDKMYAAGVLTIILGVLSIIFGIVHYFYFMKK